jgi:hypothetical protein
MSVYVFITKDKLRIAPKGCKYLLHSENDADFHNIVVSYLFNCLRVNGIAYVIIVIKLIINKVGKSIITTGAQSFTGFPRFAVNEEGPIKNIINSNQTSLDS